MMTDNYTYTSSLLPRRKKGTGTRSFVYGKAYVFEIASQLEEVGSLSRPPIILKLHSSITRKYGPGIRWKNRASTEVHLHREDAVHVIAALLAALNEEETT